MQLYFQNRVELSVDQMGYNMQHGESIRGSMDPIECQEMPGEGIRRPMLSLRERYGLHGEDHAIELDASQDRRNSHRYHFDEPRFTEFNESVLTLDDFA